MDLYDLWMGKIAPNKEEKLVQAAHCRPTPGDRKDKGQVFEWV